MTWRIGVDSGGTFTDICVFDDTTGATEIWKVPSTTGDPSQAIADGAAEALGRLGRTLADVGFFGHGTTVGTNTLIQLKGVRTGLITNDGFADLLEIGRQKRPNLYDLQQEKPPVLVGRDLRFGVAGRLSHDGGERTPLDAAAVRDAVRRLKAKGVQAVAICFLYSFLDPAHEKVALDILAEEFPEAFASASHEVAPEFREYERLSTAVVNAYLGPIMKTYIDRLALRLRDGGLAVPAKLTQSNGGVIGFDHAARLPVRTVLSGPSTGVVAGGRLGRLAGYPDVITFDMGGTSTDVALLREGECETASEAVVHGYPIKAPMLDIHTVGAGGGSIAHIDNGGLLKVGPQSAGSVPGPVCYGNGSEAPCVTDANVVLQVLNPTHLLGGRMPIRQDLSIAAIDRLAGQLGLGRMQTASGILSIVTANMAKAIRVISIQRGHDPREYALMAFGGAGPLHAARLARELEMPRVIVPPYPGIMCATGLLLTDLRADFATTQVKEPVAAEVAAIQAIYDDLAEQAGRWFEAEKIASEARQIGKVVDMRYAGQNYELAVPLAEGPITAETLARAVQDFEEMHRRIYGFAPEDEPTRLVTFRCLATGIVPKSDFAAHPEAGPDASAAVTGTRQVWLDESGGWTEVTLYDRALLRPGNRFAGPAIIEQMDATTLVLPGMTARVEPHLSLILEFE